MSRKDALLLNESLDADDVSQACLVWSGAAGTALADMPIGFQVVLPRVGVWFLGAGRLGSRLSDLVGTWFEKVRGSAADPHDAADVFS